MGTRTKKAPKKAKIPTFEPTLAPNLNVVSTTRGQKDVVPSHYTFPVTYLPIPAFAVNSSRLPVGWHGYNYKGY